jgi:hypothetical protein
MENDKIEYGKIAVKMMHSVFIYYICITGHEQALLNRYCTLKFDDFAVLKGNRLLHFIETSV